MQELDEIKKITGELPDGVIYFKDPGLDEERYLINVKDPSEMNEIMVALKQLDNADSDNSYLEYSLGGLSNNSFFAELTYQEIRKAEGKEKIICIYPIKPDTFSRVKVPRNAENVSLVAEKSDSKGAIIFNITDIKYRINLDYK